MKQAVVVPARHSDRRPVEWVKRHTMHARATCDAALLRFGASSLGCALLDIALFSMLAGILGGGADSLLWATVLARLCSGLGNCALNGRWVFRGARDAGTLLRYALLFAGQMLASWMLVSAMTAALAWPPLAKVLVDGALFFASYQIQRRFVFRPAARRPIAREDGGCEPT